MRWIGLWGAMIMATIAGGAAADDGAAVKQLTPTGKLRVAVAVSPAPSALYSVKDAATGELRGVTIELGRALARKLGVEPQFIEFLASGEIQNSAASNVWDVSFMPVDEERKKFVDFGNAYHLLQSTYLVAPGAKLATVADVNRAGVRIAGVADNGDLRASCKASPNATHVLARRRRRRRRADARRRGRRHRAVARIARDARRQDPGLTRARRRLPQLHHRHRGPQEPPGRARLCDRLHRGRESLRRCAPLLRPDGSDRLAGGAGRDEAVVHVPARWMHSPSKTGVNAL